jgi:hypothetical protein
MHRLMLFKRFFSFSYVNLCFFIFVRFFSVFFVFDIIFIFVRLFVFQMKKDVRKHHQAYYRFLTHFFLLFLYSLTYNQVKFRNLLLYQAEVSILIFIFIQINLFKKKIFTLDTLSNASSLLFESEGSSKYKK